MSNQFSGMLPQIIMLALAAGVAVTLVILALVAVVGAPRARMKKRIAAVVSAGPQIATDTKGDRVVIPASMIGYVLVPTSQSHRVGFGRA